MPDAYRPIIFAALLSATFSLQAQDLGDFRLDPQTVEAMRDSAAEVGGNLLQRAIASSRAEALRAGVQPLPPTTRAKLRGFYPDALLDRVRWRVGGGSDQSLQLNAIQYGDQAAITLDEVVVFAREADALGQDALWAHELWHVHQVQDWGLPEFARRYARDYRVVEGDAERAAARYVAWRRQLPQAR